MNHSDESQSTTKPLKRILMVDDEPAMTGVMRLVLENTGKYEVREENHSGNALDAAYEFKPDLILLDVMMPGLDGADVIYRLRDDPRLKDIPVVFHTATVRKLELDAHGGLISGYPFLAKPATAAQLLECIEKHLLT